MTKIAICISTRNRPEAFAKCVDNLHKFWPVDYDAQLFVVDDASEDHYVLRYQQHEVQCFTTRQGIPIVKNRCLAMAYDWGADHVFCFDDDCYPIKHGWAEAYINSGINHLSFTFHESKDGVHRQPKPQRWGNFRVYFKPNGCMMYFTRKCLDVVGGFDTQYSPGYLEHTDLTRRIWNAGLTPFKNMDIADSLQYFHSMDYHGEIDRSISAKDRTANIKANIEYFHKNKNSKRFIEFR